MQRPGPALEDLPRHRLADGPGAADDQKAPVRDQLGQQRFMPRQVRLEQGLVPANQFQYVHHPLSLFALR